MSAKPVHWLIHDIFGCMDSSLALRAACCEVRGEGSQSRALVTCAECRVWIEKNSCPFCGVYSTREACCDEERQMRADDARACAPGAAKAMPS